MSLKTFSANNFLDAKYYHIAFSGVPLFRIRTHKRVYSKQYNTYRNGMGRIFNFNKWQVAIIPNQK